MMPEETAAVLAKCASVDLRTVGRSDVLAWHELIGELDFPTALEAVRRWYSINRDRIMPSDVLALADEIRREKIRRDDHRRALESARPAELPLKDRSQEIQDFVQSIRDVLPKGDPDSLRYGHRYWREIREARERAATAEPNPHYDPGALAKLAEMAPPPPPSPEGEPHVTTTQPSEKVDD